MFAILDHVGVVDLGDLRVPEPSHIGIQIYRPNDNLCEEATLVPHTHPVAASSYPGEYALFLAI
jgi:hypothetical protein